MIRLEKKMEYFNARVRIFKKLSDRHYKSFKIILAIKARHLFKDKTYVTLLEL